MTSRLTAGIDDNAVKSLLAVSSADGESIVVVWADPTTHALLVKTVGTGLTLETNGTLNGSQTLLNLVAGTNITLSDNVGIGTSTPTATLDIQGTSTTPELTVASSTGATSLGVDASGRVVVGAAGLATLVAGTVTVTPGVPIDSNTLIFLTDQNGAGTVGNKYISATTTTTFVITSTNALDTGNMAWEIIQK